MVIGDQFANGFIGNGHILIAATVPIPVAKIQHDFLPDLLFQRHVFDFLFNIHSKPPVKAPVNDRRKDNPKGSKRPAILFVPAFGQRQTENGLNRRQTNRKKSISESKHYAYRVYCVPAARDRYGAFSAGKRRAAEEKNPRWCAVDFSPDTIEWTLTFEYIFI
ncbi:hypothetical protein [Serratia ureilytica]|uniref:hypothetical protein n=1 Tax=Serratia ureilytica TaxID=300181 RepID=UPI001D1880A3|nr:hypothetical protein [Serratia ureilytica]MCC4104290.1 hypothetical protein [Serratia ureilytica]